MGIPVYFKTLVSEYSDTILHKDKYDDIDSLFFDLNCLIPMSLVQDRRAHHFYIYIYKNNAEHH